MAPNDAFVTSFFQIPYTSAVSYARLWQKHAFHIVSHDNIDRARRDYASYSMNITYQAAGMYYTAALLPAAAVVYSRYICTLIVLAHRKKVKPLESSHHHHRPAFAASTRVARGRSFDPKRATTTPGCRAWSARREHRVVSLLQLDMIKLRLPATAVYIYEYIRIASQSSSTSSTHSGGPHRSIPRSLQRRILTKSSI